MCDSGNPVVKFILGFFKFLANPIGEVLNQIANFVLSAAYMVFGALIAEIPTLESMNPSQQINRQTQWLVVYLAVGSLIFAAGKMALERKGTAGITALKGIMRVVLVSGAATMVIGSAVVLSDAYADHLFTVGAEKHLDSIGSCSDFGGIGAFAKLILAFLLLLSAILQTILLYVRMGVLIVLLGTLPMAAAASMTDWGASWWRKHLAWLIAWLLYKPAVGLVLYAGSVMLNSGKGEDEGDATIHTRIAGVAVMLLSAVALPALLKLIVPAVGALGTGNPGGEAMSVAGGIASGAIQLAGRGSPSSGGGSGGAGTRGPSGAASSGGGAGVSGAAGGKGSPGTSGAGGSAGGGSSGTKGEQGGPSGAGRGGGSGNGAGVGSGGGGAGAASGAGRAAAVAGPAGVAAAATVGVVAAGTQAAARGAAQGVESNDPQQGSS
ncbi:hypothetical protein AB0D49_34320 [Streptomyces sp. NPDC048290]|uniref:hypothetical protein n=1 Tax=Streptomyces sp. NPDC048290 TaxID=3155811 RepID=UPI0034142614